MWVFHIDVSIYSRDSSEKSGTWNVSAKNVENQENTQVMGHIWVYYPLVN
jgi:hypothetical protein